MRPNLVLARVGAQSLHPEWIDPSRPRSWDLRLVPYQTIPPQGDVDCTVGEVVPGPKWAGTVTPCGRGTGGAATNGSGSRTTTSGPTSRSSTRCSRLPRASA